MRFSRCKKIILAVAIATIICLVLSGFSLIVHSQTTSGFTLPATVNTTGNAWDGALVFDLEINSAFTGSLANTNYLVVMDTNGTVLDLRESDYGYGAAYNIAPDTVLFQGEPQVSGGNASGPGAADAPTYATHIWNLSSDTTEDFPNVIGHHDIQYDPVNNTFLTLQDYVRQINNTLYLYDQIVQLDPNGTMIWSLDTYNFIPPSENSPFNDTTLFNGQTVVDLTHANDLDWDYNDSIIYLNVRDQNTFYEINQTTGDVIWACGEFGNFTLLGANGQPLPDVTAPNGAIVPPSLWYHSHDTKEVAPDVFTMFDNDYENNSNPDDCHSQILEVTLNTTSMTAYVNWSWEAPTSYWNSYGGATLLLPNGDFIADFGDPTHQNQQNSIDGADQSWDFNNTGAVFVEVNPSGQVVRTWTFPVGCYVYRIATIINPTSGDFPTAAPVSTPTPTPTSVPVIPPSAPVITQPTTPVITSTPTPVTSTPTPSIAPTSSPLPSSTPIRPINSQTIIASIALTAVVVVVVVLVVMFYMRKRISKHKIDASKEDD